MHQNKSQRAGRVGASFFSGMRGHGVQRPARSEGRTVGQPTARMLRDTASGVLAGRHASLVDSRDDIRRVWMRSAALAQDIVQNSGRLKGAVETVIGDTVGDGLKLSPAPKLDKYGWTKEEISDWSKEVKDRWEEWSKNPSECDYRGKLTIDQMIDVALRYDFSFGEYLSVLDYFGPDLRQRYGVKTGTKLLMVPPMRLVQETSESTGLFQGVLHDENGRISAYRIRSSDRSSTKDYPAYINGRRSVLHVFDPEGADDVRGISDLAACFKTYIAQEKLSDTTLQQAIAQAAVAMVLTSDLPSPEAFEAFQELGETNKGFAALGNNIMGYLAEAYAGAANASGIRFGDGPIMPHLTPGESFDFKTASVPGNNYIPFSQDLRREVASAIGVTYSSYSNDYSNATYSSVRMEVSSIWPRVIRRRFRKAAPKKQHAYEAWLDEEIGMGRMWYKGGYAAFVAQKESAVWAAWNGPAPPTADDEKATRAAVNRIESGLSSIEIECSRNGIDGDEVYAMRLSDHRRHLNDGLPSPYQPKASQPAGGPANDNGDEAKQGADQ